MINLNDLRENPDKYIKACRDKKVNFDITQFLNLDLQYRQAKIKLEEKKALQNSISKEIPKLLGNDKEEKLSEMKSLSADIKNLTHSFNDIEEEWNKQQLFIPSVPLLKVPIGETDVDNVPVRFWGDIPNFDFSIKDHSDLGKDLDIIDVERGVKIAGARSYFLKGDGARLQHAVLQLACDLLYQKGYTLFDCPHIVNYNAMMGTSYFPGGEEMAYHLDDRDPDSYLIGTSEVSVCSYKQDEILKLEELPLRYAGYSPCYRREAGTYGKDTRGLYRVHQFYKIEQVVICKADEAESEKMHKEILTNAEEFLQLLELPYRVVDVCTGDMGQGQIYKNDIETWMPSRNAYSETHSCSTFFDFQARRLKIRYKDDQGSNTYCHTLNNTCVASPRILIPILETYQNPDGTVRVPKALQKYMGGQELIVKK